MRQSIFLLLSLLLCWQMQAQTIQPANQTGYYVDGENPQFSVSGANGSAYELYFDDDFLTTSATKITGTVSGGTVTVPTNTVTDGVVFCKIGGATSSLLYNPNKISSKEAPPAGFENFWAGEVSKSKKDLNNQDLSFDESFAYRGEAYHYKGYTFSLRFRNNNNPNVRIHGVMSIPKAAGPHPVIIRFPAYDEEPVPGNSIYGEEEAVFISLSLQEDPFNRQSQIDPSLNTSKENFYYKHVILGGMRVIEFLSERTSFVANGNTVQTKANANEITTFGASQGGLSTIVAGLDHLVGQNKVIAVATSQPGFGELQMPEAANTLTRATSFPRTWQWVPWGANPATSVTAYYNAPYFMSYYDGPLYCDLGLLDDICPAETVYKTINAASDEVIIINNIEAGHSVHGELYGNVDVFISQYTSLLNSNPYPRATVGADQVVSSQLNVNGNIYNTNNGTITNTTISTDSGPQSRFQKFRWEIIECLSGSCGLPNNTVLATTQNLSYNFASPGTYLVRFSFNDIERLSSNTFLTLRDHLIVTVTGGSGGNPQSINFPPISNKLTTDSPFSLNATATSNLPVSYQIISGPATVAGSTVSLTGTAGTVTVRASQAGNANWNAAPNVDQTFTVSQAGNCGGGGSNVSDCNVTIGINGLDVSLVSTTPNGDQIIKIRTASWSYQADLCNDYSSNPFACGSGASITVPSAGSYIVDIQGTTNCNFPINVTGSGGGGTSDDDNDGICSDVDCDDDDASIGAQQTPGTSCDDGDASTENDEIQANGCTCAGTPIGGGSCNNYETECAEVKAYGCANRIDIEVTGGNVQYVKIMTSGWQQVSFECTNWASPNCSSGFTSSETVSPGSYIIEVKYTNGNPPCYITVVVPGSSRTSTNSSDLPSIYPNPTHNKVWVDLGMFAGIDHSILVYDVLGNLVIEKSQNAVSSTSLDISKLGKGLYFVVIENKDLKSAPMKLVKLGR